METIRISNLRCLADSTSVEIKPISLLVGANSPGKSTFVRIFPLLKQSHEIRTLGGLVFNEGDVDFGFFNEALRDDATPPEMKLAFGFTMRHGTFQGAPWNRFLLEPIEANCEFTYVKRTKDQRYPRLRAFSLTLQSGEFKDQIDLLADEDGQLSHLKINSFESKEELRFLRLRITRGIVPRLIVILEKDDAEAIYPAPDNIPNPFDKTIEAETKAMFHGRTLSGTKQQMFQTFRIGSPEKMLEEMRSTGAASWQDRVKLWSTTSEPFVKLRNLILARRLNEILESVNIYVMQLSRSVFYFQPVRANVQRDYPSRDVSVASVDPSGANVALLLASMPPLLQRQFREWMRTSFGFEIYPQSVSDGARIALRMKEVGSGNEYNLADTGFGFSQMLPFLVQVWSLVYGKTSQRYRSYSALPYRPGNTAVPTSYIVAIEQPELHLHPALQAKLADLIVNMAITSQKNEMPIRFMLETHSPTIIERIGQSIDEKTLSASDVQVLLFERDRTRPEGNTAKVSTACFDAEGILQNWPFGFLSAPLTDTAGKA